MAKPVSLGVRHTYGYVRVSHDDQVDSGLSLLAQKEALETHFTHKLEKKGYVNGGIFVEEAESAWSKAFKSRPKGSELHKRLAPGDMIVIPKLDRAFRRVTDCLAMLDLWDSMGVSLTILDLGGQEVDTSSPIGRLVITVLAGVAEFESSHKSERTRLALRQRYARLLRECSKKLLGEGKITEEIAKAHETPREDRTAIQEGLVEKTRKLYNIRAGGKQKVPLGMRYAGPKGRQKLVVDEEEVKWMRILVEWRDVGKRSVDTITRHLLRERVRTREGNTWSDQRVKRMIIAGRILLLHEQGKCGPVDCHWCKYKPAKELAS